MGAIKIPLQVTFRNMPPSGAIEAHVREKAAKLDLFYERIMSCRVVIEAPHRRHRKGKLYHVRIDITVPGAELVIKREPRRVAEPPLGYQKEPDVDLAEDHDLSKYAAHEDLYISVRDAFDAARRKLQDHARRQRGATKIHEAQPSGRVSRLFPKQGFGFIETSDGREIYFHRNSVLEPGFNRLEPGAAVFFAEEQGEKGPQASTVKLVGKAAVRPHI